MTSDTAMMATIVVAVAINRLLFDNQNGNGQIAQDELQANLALTGRNGGVGRRDRRFQMRVGYRRAVGQANEDGDARSDNYTSDHGEPFCRAQIPEVSGFQHLRTTALSSTSSGL
jgi:hypothetical protein